MFEKLKEFSLFIIISLIWLWVLTYSFLNTNNTQKWSVIITKVHEWILSWITKSKVIKNVTTISDHLKDINWSNIWEYLLDTSKIYLTNSDWDLLSTQIDKIHNWNLYLNTTQNTTEQWKISLHLLTHKTLWHTTNSEEYILSSKKIIKNWYEITSDEKKFKWINEELRWYLPQWYIWFWTFKTHDEATKIRDSYFSNWIVLQWWTDKFAIFVRM